MFHVQFSAHTLYHFAGIQAKPRAAKDETLQELSDPCQVSGLPVVPVVSDVKKEDVQSSEQFWFWVTSMKCSSLWIRLCRRCPNVSERILLAFCRHMALSKLGFLLCAVIFLGCVLLAKMDEVVMRTAFFHGFLSPDDTIVREHNLIGTPVLSRVTFPSSYSVEFACV